MNLLCEKCGHTWLTRTDSKPKVCPSCKSKTWMMKNEKSRKSVYVVSFDNGTTKIGISSNVDTRIKTLSSEYNSCTTALYKTNPAYIDIAKNTEQQVLFILREYMINGSELLSIDFESVKNAVLLVHNGTELSVTDILLSGETFLPVTPLISKINGERFSKGDSPFNLSAWLASKDNIIFIEDVKGKFGNAIIKKQGGYTYAHKFIFADIGISAGGNVKMEILEYLGGRVKQ